MLRVRQVDGRFTQTIKRSGTPIPIERDEWEEEVDGLKPEMKAIRETAIGRLFVKEVGSSDSWRGGLPKRRRSGVAHDHQWQELVRTDL